MIWVLLQSESPWQRNDAITLFIYLCVSLYQEFFLKKSKGVCTCHNCLHYGRHSIVYAQYKFYIYYYYLLKELEALKLTKISVDKLVGLNYLI